ncbi:hypothetical protein AVMA1855_09580 [Acidovorax sp. SUPP1855]|uniref:hypothetical protein n=1 Tax=Acidovorax sp. SUPP1855 TaxID=431774 RepID=UPI0023DE3666|nr:hypothetical protein [Acidovorax sp. SUPP1855]GKS84390.1 hypothetical protein AVMA1855_09580 [Acidovorax sp. SUPP1855]
MHAMIRWKIKPDQVERELELLAAVYEELQQRKPGNLDYSTFQLDDKVTFVAMANMPHGLGVLADLPAFHRYRSTLDARCEQRPIVTELGEIGLYTSVPRTVEGA